MAAKGGCTLTWRDLTVKLRSKRSRHVDDIESSGDSEKYILNDVSGYVDPGSLLFIMGPSGSGKTTILDCLADRLSLPVKGSQMLDGKIKTPLALKSVAKYVQQTDDLIGALSVKETFDTAAGFYIGDSEKRGPAVEKVINLLGLEAHKDTKVGNSFVRGLSGGQVRRVSIGCELVASPKLLFLDEPTSGLDSATSYNVMKELKAIAQKTGTAMIITIHQPSELVFEMADRLLLISEGNTCYFGDSHQAATYFTKLGFKKSPRVSEIEWILDLVNKDFGNPENVQKCIDSWKGSENRKTLDSDLKTRKHGGDEDDSNTTEQSVNKMQYAVSFFQQTKILLRRGVLNTIRNPAVLWLRFAMYLMLSIMIGAVWTRLGNSSARIQDINNALFYICAFMVFMSVSVLPAYLEERSVLVRERANGAYSVAAYITAHTLYEIPYVFCLALMASLVTYWFVGLTPTATRFFVFLANLFMSLFVAESVMVLLAALIPILIVAIAAGAMMFGAFMCVMGAFISIDRIGWWFRWLHYVAFHFYAYSTFMVNQFRDTTWTASPDTFPPFLNNVDGNDVISSLGLEERMWVNFLVLLAMAAFYRITASLYLHLVITGKK